MIGNSWDNVLNETLNSIEFKSFMNLINEDYNNYDVYPTKENVFKNNDIRIPSCI